jgi:hypothetical protein
VPIPVSFQLHHDWDHLPGARAARPVRNPVGAARCPRELADPLARTAAQTDSPARVHLAPDLFGKRKLSPRMYCCQLQEELHRLAPCSRREAEPWQGGFQRGVEISTKWAKCLKTTFPTHRVKTAPFFDLRRGIAIKWVALGRLSSRDNSVKISTCQRWVN